MPVIGHALVGIITAQEFEPGSRRNPRALGPVAQALWMPALVSLAYVPDVVTQLGLWLGLGSAKAFGHSMLVGLPIGLLIGVGWARLSRGSPRIPATLAVALIQIHNLMDLLQANDRQPFWPLSLRTIDAGSLALPDQLSAELLVFGLPYAAYEARRLFSRRAAPAGDVSRTAPWIAWASRVLVGALLLSAVTIQVMRGRRQDQMDVAEQLLRSKRFVEALEAIDVADAWPAAGGAGADILRGEAYKGLGNSARAELLYQRAYRNEPDNFWAERESRARPYVNELRKRFSSHPDFHAVMRRVERATSAVP
jgi:hypothetical protein